VQRPRLISTLSLAGFALAVSIVLVLLYPQQRLSEQTRNNIKIDEASLQYIKNLLATEPDNHELRLQLAKSYAAASQYENALATLQPLYTNLQANWREEAWLLKLNILLKIAYSATPGSADRKQKMAQFLSVIRASESQFASAKILRQFITLAEKGTDSQLAESVATRLMLTSDDPEDLDKAAQLALANGRYLESAQFTWRARQLASNSTQKITYLKLALSTLQAGGIGHIGLDWVRQLPVTEWQSEEVLYDLTKLALASNQPAAAAEFAARLVGFNKPVADGFRINPAYYELAYAAFMAHQDLQHGLKLAQLAVSEEPDNLIWRERLAHVAEWSVQPRLAVVHWRWLAMHRGSEADWQAWMRLAQDLFDYDAQLAGLERDWKQNGKKQKYALKIVQLHEHLGQPETALAWLDGHSENAGNPELVLLSAELLERMGREAEALDRFRRYLKRNIASPEVAATIAGMMQRAGLYDEAFGVLKRSQSMAKPEHELFWANFGELAWTLKKYDDAEIAYQILSNAPEAEINHQVRLVQLQKKYNSPLAAKTAEKYWLKTGHIDLFMHAADSYATLKDWPALQNLYKQTASPKWREYDNHLPYVSLRAEMHKQTKNLTAAEHDYQLMAAQHPEDLSIKESYLWLLIDAHKHEQLDVLMQRWARLLPTSPGLWDVFAAGHQVLNRPTQALILYERMAITHARDELWLLNYAGALEAGGQVKKAGIIRGQIWQQHRKKQTSHAWLNTRAREKDIEALRLLLLNDPALGQSVLWKLLRQGSAELKQNSQFAELATVWLNEHDQNDAARAWLIRQYAHTLVATR
jgi:predicted Zn-dependent protease